MAKRALTQFRRQHTAVELEVLPEEVARSKSVNLNSQQVLAIHMTRM